MLLGLDILDACKELKIHPPTREELQQCVSDRRSQQEAERYTENLGLDILAICKELKVPPPTKKEIWQWLRDRRSQRGAKRCTGNLECDGSSVWFFDQQDDGIPIGLESYLRLPDGEVITPRIRTEGELNPEFLSRVGLPRDIPFDPSMEATLPLSKKLEVEMSEKGKVTKILTIF
jgi:hypothetical protein